VASGQWGGGNWGSANWGGQPSTGYQGQTSGRSGAYASLSGGATLNHLQGGTTGRSGGVLIYGAVEQRKGSIVAHGHGYALLSVIRNFYARTPTWPQQQNIPRQRGTLTAQSGGLGYISIGRSGQIYLSGAAAIRSTVTGTVQGGAGPVRLSGAATGRADLTATAAHAVHLRGQATGRFYGNGILPFHIAHGYATGHAGVYATIRSAVPVSGATGGVSTGNATLGFWETMPAAATAGRSGAYAKIVAPLLNLLQGDSAGSSSTAGRLVLATPVALSGAVNARSTGQANMHLGVHQPISGDTAARSAARANMVFANTLPLSAAGAGRSSAYGTLAEGLSVPISGVSGARSGSYGHYVYATYEELVGYTQGRTKQSHSTSLATPLSVPIAGHVRPNSNVYGHYVDATYVQLSGATGGRSGSSAQMNVGVHVPISGSIPARSVPVANIVFGNRIHFFGYSTGQTVVFGLAHTPVFIYPSAAGQGKSNAYGQFTFASPLPLAGASRGRTSFSGRVLNGTILPMPHGYVRSSTGGHGQFVFATYLDLAGNALGRFQASAHVIFGTYRYYNATVAGRSGAAGTVEILTPVSLTGVATGRFNGFAGPLTIIKHYLVGTNDSFPTTDSIQRGQYIGSRQPTDPIPTTDSARRFTWNYRQIADSFTFSDAVTALHLHVRDASDGIPTVTDSDQRVFTGTRMPVEKLYVSDKPTVIGPPVAPPPPFQQPPVPNSLCQGRWTVGQPFTNYPERYWPVTRYTVNIRGHVTVAGFIETSELQPQPIG
jgi:hypothetical protein